MQAGVITYLQLIVLITYGKSASCCLCPGPELVSHNESYFCGQELRGSDCKLNAKFICDIGSVTAEIAEEDCNGRASPINNCAPPSYQRCKQQWNNITSPVLMARCLRSRYCIDLKMAKNFWKIYNSTDPKLRFQNL
jgi:hypothetical protein